MTFSFLCVQRPVCRSMFLVQYKCLVPSSSRFFITLHRLLKIMLYFSLLQICFFLLFIFLCFFFFFVFCFTFELFIYYIIFFLGLQIFFSSPDGSVLSSQSFFPQTLNHAVSPLTFSRFEWVVLWVWRTGSSWDFLSLLFQGGAVFWLFLYLSLSVWCQTWMGSK